MIAVNKSLHYIVLLICTPISLLILTYLITIGDFNVMREFHYSTVFFDMFNRLSRLDFGISPDLIGSEAFRVNGITTTYFLPFPSLIRGALSIFGYGKSAVLSVLLASAVYLLSQGLLFLEVLNNQKIIGTKYKIYSSVGLACITLAPPIIPMMSYPNMFIEAIIWGYSIFTLILYLCISLLTSPSQKKLILFSLMCGIGLFTRAPYSLTITILFLLTVYLIWSKHNYFLRQKKLSYASLGIFVGFLGILGAYNLMKWGSPLEFYSLEHYGYGPTELAEFQKQGALHWSRMISGFSYYFLPNSHNFISQWPFINISSFGVLEGLGRSINYREPSYPIPLSIPIYFILTIVGMLIVGKIIYHTLKNSSFNPILPSALCALIPPLIITCHHARAIRYMGEFIPAITLFSIIGITILLNYMVNLGPNNWASLKFQKIFYFVFISICMVFTLFFGAASILKQNYSWGINEIWYSTQHIAFNKKYMFNRYQSNLPGESVGNDFLKSGWAEPESGLIWSSSINSFMRIPLPYFTKDIDIKLSILALVNKRHPIQTFNLYVNKKFVKQYQINLSETSINIAIHRIPLSNSSLLEKITGNFSDPTFIDIHFEFLSPTTPKKIGIGSDDREISIALISMDIQTPLDYRQFDSAEIKKGLFFK